MHPVGADGHFRERNGNGPLKQFAQFRKPPLSPRSRKCAESIDRGHEGSCTSSCPTLIGSLSDKTPMLAFKSGKVSEQSPEDSAKPSRSTRRQTRLRFCTS